MGDAYIFVFVTNGANLAYLLLQMDANEIEMKKKDKNFDSAPSSRAYL
jgi:hypothetical protein